MNARAPNPATAPDPAPAAPLAGQRLGRYELGPALAEGGMGTVYVATLRAPDGFHKRVAVKVVQAHAALHPEFVRMFIDEARLAARVDHPNVGQVFDFGEQNGTRYLAMEYLHGEPLAQLVRAAVARIGAVPAALAARTIADAARGLHAIHEIRRADGSPADVVHRDVSPQNLFVLYSGTTKVVDLGIARAADRLSERTQTGVLKGKPAYLAPEQVLRQPFDRRADLFALGIVLWEASVGRRLFKGDSELSTLMAVAHEPVPAPSTLRADYPVELERIVMRALERDPTARYASAAEMARDLERYLATADPPASVDDVAEFMRETFAERIAARERLLEASTRVADGDPVARGAEPIDRSPSPALAFEPTTPMRSPPGSAVPSARVDSSPSVTGEMAGGSDGGVGAAPERFQKPRAWKPGLVAAVVSSVIALGAVARLGHRERTNAPSSAVAASDARATPSPTVLPIAPRAVAVHTRPPQGPATVTAAATPDAAFGDAARRLVRHQSAARREGPRGTAAETAPGARGFRPATDLDEAL